MKGIILEPVGRPTKRRETINQAIDPPQMETLRIRLAQHRARKLTTDQTVRAKGHQQKIQTVQENLENTHMGTTLQQVQKGRNTYSLNSYDPVVREKVGTMTNKT